MTHYSLSDKITICISAKENELIRVIVKGKDCIWIHNLWFRISGVALFQDSFVGTGKIMRSVMRQDSTAEPNVQTYHNSSLEYRPKSAKFLIRDSVRSFIAKKRIFFRWVWEISRWLANRDIIRDYIIILILLLLYTFYYV